MNTKKTTTTAPTPTPRTERPDYVKKINKTTYKVNVHFNPNARETMQDKIIRMLRNEVSQM